MGTGEENPSKFKTLWKDFWDFVCALWPHTAGFITGGTVAAVIAIISAFGVPIPHWVVWALIALAFFASAFNAYRRPRKITEISKLNFQWPLVFLSFAACVSLILVLANYEFISPLIKVLTKPDLSTDQIISQISDDASNPKNHFVIFDLTILNNGAPSVIRHVGLKITSKDKPEIDAPGCIITGGIFTNFITGGGMTFRYSKDSFIEDAGSIPIERGGERKGFITFSVQGINRDYLLSPETKYELRFWDVAGREYDYPNLSSPLPSMK